MASLCFLSNRLYFIEQFQIHSKIERKVQRFPYNSTYDLQKLSLIFGKMKKKTLYYICLNFFFTRQKVIISLILTPCPFDIQFDIMVYQEDHNYKKSHSIYYLCLKMTLTTRKN